MYPPSTPRNISNIIYYVTTYCMAYAGSVFGSYTYSIQYLHSWVEGYFLSIVCKGFLIRTYIVCITYVPAVNWKNSETVKFQGKCIGSSDSGLTEGDYSHQIKPGGVDRLNKRIKSTWPAGDLQNWRRGTAVVRSSWERSEKKKTIVVQLVKGKKDPICHIAGRACLGLTFT